MAEGVHTDHRTLARGGALAFLAAAATLLLQVLVHRMVSAKLLNNYAFLVISLTMLGFAFSGVVLTRLLDRFLARWGEAQTACASGFVLSTLVVSAAFYHLDAGNQFTGTMSGFLRESARWMPAALLFAVPFAFTGLMLGALLSDPRLPAPRIYGLDLLGSSVGAIAVIPAIRHLGVETSALLTGAGLLLGTVILAPPRRWTSRGLAIAAALALLIAGGTRDRLFQMRPRAGSTLSLRELVGPPYGLEYLQWDPVARIEVTRVLPPDPGSFAYPSLIGSEPLFLEHFRRMLTQNDYAFTYMVDYDGNAESLRGIEQTIYAAAYEATSVASPRVLVVGVGGGFDVLTGLRYRAGGITGVEINGATLDIVRRVYADYCRAWSHHPRVRLVEDDGRHYLATTDARYDVIQLSGVDSYSGTPAAAHVFSESYLYTAEAFDLYLSRLSDGGILNMMRLEYTPVREMLRALVTAVGALRRAGAAHPAAHVRMITAVPNNFAALLLKRTPFTPEEDERLAAWTGRSPHFALAAAPALNARRENLYQVFLDLDDAARERAFVALYPFDVSAARDDRPFFFRYSLWPHLFSRDPVHRFNMPVMEVSLLMLAAAIGLAALLCVYLPVRLLLRRGARLPSRGRWAAFFVAIGLGFFAIEIALLQKFGLFLGHPNYALSVVLAALLVASGLGALVSSRLLRRLRELRFFAYVLAAVVLVEYLLALPLLPRLDRLGFAARAALVSTLILPIGLCLGAFLPQGMERLKRVAPEFVPWAWGVNGVFSVLAPVLAVAVSISWGISALLLAALPVYLVAGFALPPARGALD